MRGPRFIAGGAVVARKKVNPGSLKGLMAKLNGLSQTVSNEVAQKSAEKINTLARATFAAGQNAYGDPWPLGAENQNVTLKKSGKLAADIHYVATGNKLRCVLGPGYAKYQIGKRQVFPRMGSKLPDSYIEAIKSVTAEAIEKSLKDAK